jgi:hypothetical protein
MHKLLRFEDRGCSFWLFWWGKGPLSSIWYLSHGSPFKNLSLLVFSMPLLPRLLSKFCLPQDLNSFFSNSRANDKQSQIEAWSQPNDISPSLWEHCLLERRRDLPSTVPLCSFHPSHTFLSDVTADILGNPQVLFAINFPDICVYREGYVSCFQFLGESQKRTVFISSGACLL